MLSSYHENSPEKGKITILKNSDLCGVCIHVAYTHIYAYVKDFFYSGFCPSSKISVNYFLICCVSNTVCFIVINCFVTFVVLMTGRTEKHDS